MPKYIMLLKLPEQGARDVRNAPERIENAMKLHAKMGGKLVGFYMVMGEYVYIGIDEAPSDEVATAFALAASKRAGLPPKVGQRATTANSMPGTRTSRPKRALPSTFA